MLYHIASDEDVKAARPTGTYKPAAFDRERFVHCSYRAQLVAVANRIFRGRSGLVVLEIDPAKLECPVIDENLEGGTELYPHVYGAIPLAAVRAIHLFPCHEDGRFEMPRDLTVARDVPGYLAGDSQ